jgi:hypothetical protein
VTQKQSDATKTPFLRVTALEGIWRKDKYHTRRDVVGDGSGTIVIKELWCESPEGNASNIFYEFGRKHFI